MSTLSSFLIEKHIKLSHVISCSY